MKYMIAWKERSQGSAIEYERAQQRILDVFRQWETPANSQASPHFLHDIKESSSRRGIPDRILGPA